MSKHLSRPPYRRITSLLWLGALAAVACGSADGTQLLRPGAGSFGGSGPETVGSSGASGMGSSGTGGSGGATRDAGLDAAADAAPPPSCVVGPLDQYCALGDDYCPANYADARAKLHEVIGVSSPLLILQQGCAAPDGSARVRVSGVYLSWSRSYIYDPTTGQLVSVQLYDDLGGCGGPVAYGFGSVHGFYGEDLPGCSFSYSNFEAPPVCGLPRDWRYLDAGTPRNALNDAGADAGSLENGAPYECILAP